MRVFPQMVMHSDKTSTYASAEQFFLAHVVHSLGPWVERWEQTISRDVLTDEEARGGLFPKLAVQGLLRGDTKARVEYYTGMINIAAMNPNEVRSLEDMNPYDGGDTYRAQLNTADATLPPPSAEPAAPVKEPADAAV
jgi:phage portal protein BeeE